MQFFGNSFLRSYTLLILWYEYKKLIFNIILAIINTSNCFGCVYMIDIRWLLWIENSVRMTHSLKYSDQKIHWIEHYLWNQDLIWLGHLLWTLRYAVCTIGSVNAELLAMQLTVWSWCCRSGTRISSDTVVSNLSPDIVIDESNSSSEQLLNIYGCDKIELDLKCTRFSPTFQLTRVEVARGP